MSKYDDMLMDVDAMDFIEDVKMNQTSIDSDPNATNNENLQTYVNDPTTGEIIMKLTNDEELPLKDNFEGVTEEHLKFKLGPSATNNFAFITGTNQSKIFPVKLPRVDTTNEYFNYILKLYEIYDSLGEHRIFCIPTMGLINSDFIKEHSQIVNLAMDTMVSELEIFIDSVRDQELMLPRYLELEDTLTILNCLRLIYFTNEKINEIDNRQLFFERLINWVNRSDGEPNAEYIESVFGANGDGSVEIFEMDQFWKLINKLLNRSLFTQVIGCLERSGLMNYLSETCETTLNVMKDFIELIKQYPMDSIDTFREWKNLTLELSETFATADTPIDFELREFIQDSLLLISGNKDKILQYSNTWYESVCGLMVYYIPSYELLIEFLETSIENNPINTTNVWEKNCLDIITGNIHLILPDLESMDTCTASFIACLVESKGLLEKVYSNRENETENIDIDENDDEFKSENEYQSMASYMLLNFAFEISSIDNKELWPICIGLISKIPHLTNRKRKQIISELILHYPYKTNDDIEWMFSVCAEWKLSDISRSIYTMLGSTMLNEGKTIEAMSNYSKAGKFELLKEYSWTLLEASVMNKGPLDDEILNAIVSDDKQISHDIINNLVTDSMRQVLSPYAVLFEYYRLVDNNENDRAFQLLIDLIEFPYLPKRQLILLIGEILYPIFIDNEISQKINIRDDDLIKIMKCLESKLDFEDSACEKIYETIINNKVNDSMDEEDNNKSNRKDIALPETLFELNQHLRNQLSIKLCKEFM